MVRVGKTLEKRISSSYYSLQIEEFKSWSGLKEGLQKNSSSRFVPNPSILISHSCISSFFPIQSPLLLRNYSLFIPRDTSPSMAQKFRVFSSSRNGKGTSLRRGEGGFAAADPRPLISGFLVRCGEGGLHNCEVLRRDKDSIRRGKPVAFLLLPFCHLCFCSVFLSFRCPFDSNIAIFYRTI